MANDAPVLLVRFAEQVAADLAAAAKAQDRERVGNFAHNAPAFRGLRDGNMAHNAPVLLIRFAEQVAPRG